MSCGDDVQAELKAPPRCSTQHEAASAALAAQSGDKIIEHLSSHLAMPGRRGSAAPTPGPWCPLPPAPPGPRLPMHPAAALGAPCPLHQLLAAQPCRRSCSAGCWLLSLHTIIAVWTSLRLCLADRWIHGQAHLHPGHPCSTGVSTVKTPRSKRSPVACRSLKLKGHAEANSHKM